MLCCLLCGYEQGLAAARRLGYQTVALAGAQAPNPSCFPVLRPCWLDSAVPLPRGLYALFLSFVAAALCVLCHQAWNANILDNDATQQSWNNELAYSTCRAQSGCGRNYARPAKVPSLALLARNSTRTPWPQWPSQRLWSTARASRPPPQIGTHRQQSRGPAALSSPRPPAHTHLSLALPVLCPC